MSATSTNKKPKNTIARKNAPQRMPVHELHAALNGIEDQDIKIHTAALWYATKGFHIVPFFLNTPKPGYPKGMSQTHATSSIKLINEWWHPTEGKYVGAAIAMAHGGASGFCALDLDVKETDGVEAFADLVGMYGEYNDGEGSDVDTLMAITPSGGRHLVFKFHPEVISNANVALPGIDSRGGHKKNPLDNGGITFVEPSYSAKKGGEYKWVEGTDDILEFPWWMADLLKGRKPKRKGAPQLQDAYVQSAPGKHGDGRDRNIYMDLLSFAGFGYSEDELWALMPEILERMDPPDEEMVAAKIESVIESDAFADAKERKEVKQTTTLLDLDTNDKGNPIKSVRNLELILGSALFQMEYGVVEYDDFTQNFVSDKKPMASVVDWSIGIQSWISNKFRIDFPKADIRDKTEYMAFSRPHANLAKEYMMSCPRPTQATEAARQQDYYGSGRKGPGPAFQMLCNEVLQLGNMELHPNYDDKTRIAYQAFLWFWMQGLVARACIPGCKMEIVLNIFGNQGIGKSLFFRDLCPDPTWFTDSLQDSIVSGGQNNKDELAKLSAKLIVEMPELNPIKKGGKSADDKLKQFISSQVDNYRRAYGRDVVDHPRTCGLCGTSNNNDVYRDPSGARRFVSIDHGDKPIRVGDQDDGTMAAIRDRVWGEVVSSFREGELDGTRNSILVAIPPRLREMQNEVNSSHKFEEAGVQDIIEWMEDKTRVTWTEIIDHARTVAGMKDAKESAIMSMVRKELMAAHQSFEFKKRVMRHTREGGKEKTNCWVNTKHLDEGEGKETPRHWSTYLDHKMEPEY